MSKEQEPTFLGIKKEKWLKMGGWAVVAVALLGLVSLL